MERGELELLIYLITSAQGLPGEPRIYGSIRLTEAAYKLCRILLERDPENEKLKALAERLEQDKGKASSATPFAGHICPQCGQFQEFSWALEMGSKTERK